MSHSVQKQGLGRNAQYHSTQLASPSAAAIPALGAAESLAALGVARKHLEAAVYDAYRFVLPRPLIKLMRY
jgi:hypothetical protein